MVLYVDHQASIFETSFTEFFFFTGKGKVEGLNDILHAYQQAYGDLFRFRIASRWIVVVSNPNLAKEVLSIRVKYPFRPEVEIVKMFGIRNNKEEGLGTLYDHFSKPVYTQRLNYMYNTQSSEPQGLDGIGRGGGLVPLSPTPFFVVTNMDIIIMNQPTHPPPSQPPGQDFEDCRKWFFLVFFTCPEFG